MKKTNTMNRNAIVSSVAVILTLGCFIAKMPQANSDSRLVLEDTQGVVTTIDTAKKSSTSMFTTSPNIIGENSNEAVIAEEKDNITNFSEPETIVPDTYTEVQVETETTETVETVAETIPAEIENEVVTETVEEASYVQSYTGSYTWQDVCNGNFYYVGADGFTVNSYEMLLVMKITEHEFGYTEYSWSGIDASTFDWMQCLMASTVINRARYGGGEFGGYTVMDVLNVPYQYMPTYELDYFQLSDPARTFRNCMSVLDGSAGTPTNVYWEGSLEGSGCSGVYGNTWYTTTWGTSVAFGYR